MLLSFRFTNHRSFRWEQQLNLTPVYAPDSAMPGGGALTVAGIFGANASGKSNCLHALWSMRRLAVASDRDVEPGLGLVRHPYRLDEEARSEPSRYVADLNIDGVLHTYGFTLDDTRILEEWLYYYPLKKRRVVFERDADDFKWGEESSKWEELDQIAGITASTALLLSTAARFGQRKTPATRRPRDPLHDVYRWFFRFRGHLRRTAHRPVPSPWPDSDADRSVVVELLKAADLGITDVRMVNAGLGQGLAVDNDVSPLLIEDGTYRRLAERAERIGRRDWQRLRFYHRGPHREVGLTLADESAGTQQLLELAIDAAMILRTQGTLMIDEVDASLHPMLTAKLIGLFRASRVNPRGSQLIFTSHDAALLGTLDGEEVLRRDEIWFTEKDAEGLSTLYQLCDFKPRREGENRQRRYLNGNYGAVPELSADIFEQALAGRGEFDAVPEE